MVMKQIEGIEAGDHRLVSAEKKALDEPFIKGLLEDICKWPGPVLKRHNDAKLLLHKLAFLADCGFTLETSEIRKAAELVLQNRDKKGVLQVLVNIPTRFGGSGSDDYSWMLCDAPLLHYTLLKLGVPKEELKSGNEYLFSLDLNAGFPCAASSDLGRFNGPGKRGTICPYATLLMVKLLSFFPELCNEPTFRSAPVSLLDHIEKRDKLYLFGVGTDFMKLKYPFIWYDILHIADVLSKYEFIQHDPRFIKMIDIVRSKTDREGFYKAGSVWMAWKGIDSGQKKTVSNWITFSVLRILKRAGIFQI